jgi:MoxR-like ATPase
MSETTESHGPPGAPEPAGSGVAREADAQEIPAFARRVAAEVARAVVGLEEELELCLAALLAGGHVLIEGPPGVAKTLLVRALAAAIGGQYARVQFTPDLMPADIIGTSVFHPGEGSFRFQPGPVFAQLLLCDEINRAPAKTQSALLEALQERAVTVDGRRHELPRPFAAFATLNPIEHEGTYPLPEAQLDRFLLKVIVRYPSAEVEERILAEAHPRPPDATPGELGVSAVSSPEEVLELCRRAAAVRVREDLCGYVVRILQATRRSGSLVLGASPRAGVALLRAAKARAALHGRDYVTPDDVKVLAAPALRHRVLLDPAEEIEGGSAESVLARLLDSVEVPR